MDSQSDSGPEGLDEALVFVYGTMKRGHSNHDYLSGARFVADVLTAPEFELVDLGDYPAMVHGGETRVSGELYAVSRRGIQWVDELEDHPEYFRRTRVRLDDGTEVFGYLLSKDQGHPYPRIPSGIWVGRKRA